MYKTEKISVTLRLTFYKEKLHKQGSFIFLTYFALFCNLKFNIHTYNNDMFMELFKLKEKALHPLALTSAPSLEIIKLPYFVATEL